MSPACVGDACSGEHDPCAPRALVLQDTCHRSGGSWSSTWHQQRQLGSAAGAGEQPPPGRLKHVRQLPAAESAEKLPIAYQG